MTITAEHWLLMMATKSYIDTTAGAVTTFAEIYANNGSGQTVEEERAGIKEKAGKLQKIVNPGVVFAYYLKAPLNSTIRPLLKDFCLNPLEEADKLGGNRLFIEFEFETDEILRIYHEIAGVPTVLNTPALITAAFGGTTFSKTALLTYLVTTFGVEPYVAP